MIGRVSPISESIRLSRSPMHQGVVVAHQSQFDGLRLTAPGVIMELSREALKAAELRKQEIEIQKVQQIGEITKHNPITQ